MRSSASVTLCASVLCFISSLNSVLGVRVDDDAEPSDNAKKYKAAQEIGFSMYTMPKKDSYIGNENVDEDLKSRTAIMKKALNNAKNAKGVDQSDSTLKVFIAPEFFFRGVHGAYKVSLVEDSAPFHGLLENLADLVSDDEWKNWLFVFGTITVGANTAQSQSLAQTHNGDDDLNLFMNFAPIIEGGGGGKKLLAFKEHKSTIDFINCTEDGKVRGNNDASCVSVSNYGDIPQSALDTLKKEGFTMVENNVFVVDGIRIGIEICLDHLQRELDNSLKHANLNPEGVQLQLVTAAGMNIKYSAVPAGGPVFLQDGGAAPKPGGPPLSAVFPSWDFVKGAKSTATTSSALGDDWRNMMEGHFDVDRYDEWNASPVLNVYPPMMIGSLNSHKWEVGKNTDTAKKGSTVTTPR